MGIFSKLATVFRTKEAQSIIDNLEDVLLEAGISPKLTYSVMDKLDKRSGGVSSQEKIIEHLFTILSDYAKEYHFELPDTPHVFMFIGVNGVGKTTSIAKFIYYLQHTYNVENENMVVAAGDTFRAGAIEQIAKHCTNLSVPLVKQQAGSDPAAVIYDTLSYAKSRDVKYLIADTAGRMNNRKDLIAQLQKIYRLLLRDLEETQITTFVVLDGNSGLNTLTQVEDFQEAIPVNTLILSKYDGSSRGGTVLSIAEKFDMPCAFLGTGEQYQDFKPFKKEDFLNEFLST